MGGVELSSVVVDFAGGSGAAWTEMVVRATKAASVTVVARILISIRDNARMLRGNN
jgi:hypothetical protein